jgi:hypothetical protein
MRVYLQAARIRYAQGWYFFKPVFPWMDCGRDPRRRPAGKNRKPASGDKY